MPGFASRVIAMFAYAASRMATSVLNRAEVEIARSGTGPEAYERVKRAQTLGGTIRRFLSATIWTTAVLMMLRELAVDITPLLTGAGILGLAVGFGAQTLIKDIISGVFIIAEDQVRVGDYAVINSMEGYVEEINLRTIVLRDIQGTVYTIANGDIRSLANQSKDFSYYVVDLGVAYDEDSDAIFAVIREAGDSMMKDPRVRPEHPGARRSAGRGQLHAVAGDAEVPDQDPAAQTVGNRARAAAASQEAASGTRNPDAVAEDGDRHAQGKL